MLVISDLADAINTAIGATDKNNAPISTTSEMTSYASAVINTLTTSLFNNAPGTINGTAPSAPGPMNSGTGTAGVFGSVNAATWVAVTLAGFPTANPSKLAAESAASCAYLSASSIMSFSSGNITGTCTATPVSSGPLTLGAGANGTISGLSGSPWSVAVLAALGTPGPLGNAIYSAIANYIDTHAEAAYATGTVNGTFAPGGGPLIGGFGAGGTIS